MLNVGTKVRIKKGLDIEKILEDFIDDDKEQVKELYSDTTTIRTITSILDDEFYALDNRDVMVEFDEVEEVNDEIVPFEYYAAQTIETIQNIIVEKKKLEEQEKKLKEKLKEAMENSGTKKFSNDILSITYINETSKTTLDSKKIKEELPKVYNKYSKTSTTAAYVKVAIK